MGGKFWHKYMQTSAASNFAEVQCKSYANKKKSSETAKLQSGHRVAFLRLTLTAKKGKN
jgi:hypothetical protein